MAILILTSLASVRLIIPRLVPIHGAPPYDIAVDEAGFSLEQYSWLLGWKRPDGPPSVGLQAGHWKNEELPDELTRLRGNTGATGGGKSEWEVNLDIAERTQVLLKKEGIVVDILPATIPKRYWADVFVAIHADGNLDTRVSGYKAAHPRRDISGSAQTLLSSIMESYGNATGLAIDHDVSENMRGYYAFAWWRREHAVHPKTASVILETGFLTSPADRRILLGNPDRAARGLADAIIAFFKDKSLL